MMLAQLLDHWGDTCTDRESSISTYRTDAKIRYAEIMLQELRDRPGRQGDDYQRSHEEAFLYHLYGAVDAFLHEVNTHHQFGLTEKEVSLQRLQQELTKSHKASPAIQEVVRLGQPSTGLLYRIQQWRHQATHRGGTPRTFYVGGPEDGERRLTDPATGQPASSGILDEFAAAVAEVKATILSLRVQLAATPP